MATETEIQADCLISGAETLGIDLTETQVRQFVRYYAELARWNKRVNLTAITEWEAVQSKHFLDSLAAVMALPAEMLHAGSFIDVGSGGGFPGLPMKLAFPGMRGTLLDATAKKTAFLEHAREALDLRHTAVRRERAETLAHESGLRESFDIAFSRAVAEIATLAELTLPFARVGGLVVMHKKADIAAEIGRAQSAIETLGGCVREVIPVALPELDDRALVVLEKQRPTNERYPRRPGMPSKRPLT